MREALDRPVRAAEDQTVRLDVPARPDYVVLARLAVAAVARLTELGDEDVADLKLALTEAAATFVGEVEGALGEGAAAAGDGPLRFAVEVAGEGLAVVVECDGGRDIRDQDRELSLAILAATVDEHESAPGSIRLVKRPAKPGG